MLETHFQTPPSALRHITHVVWKDMTGTLATLLLAFTFELCRWETGGTECAPGSREERRCKGQAPWLFAEGGLLDSCSSEV